MRMSPPVPRLSASEQAAPARRLRLVPVLGGVLVDSIGWRSIFSINLPIGALGIWLTAQYEHRAPRRRRHFRTSRRDSAFAANTYDSVRRRDGGDRPTLLVTMGNSSRRDILWTPHGERSGLAVARAGQLQIPGDGSSFVSLCHVLTMRRQSFRHPQSARLTQSSTWWTTSRSGTAIFSIT